MPWLEVVERQGKALDWRWKAAVMVMTSMRKLSCEGAFEPSSCVKRRRRNRVGGEDGLVSSSKLSTP